MTVPLGRSHSQSRIKARMLRAALAENLSVIRGGPPRPLRRADARGWAVLALVATAAFLLVGSPNPIAAGRGRAAASASSASGVSASQALAGDGAPPAPFEAPRPINPTVFRLAVRTVVLDPGHGGTDPGAGAAGLHEKDLTLDIARRLEHQLRAAGFAVTLTRQGDQTLSLQQRVEIANAADGDLFLSIHVNSIPTPVRRGVETYFLGPAGDPRGDRLAGTENSGSGYSLADFRRLLEGVYVDVRHEESRRFALAVQERLFAALARTNPQIEDRGVKQAPFVVLVGTRMPSVLAEVACLSNSDDTLLLEQDSYRQDVAAALAAGVRGYAAARGAAEASARLRATAE
jgi:N-acetylmuramoyl-L-alanine amidase